MRISALTSKVMGSALLAGLTFVAVQAMPVQAAVPDGGGRQDQQVTAYRDYRDGNAYNGGYAGDRPDQRGAAACTTSWFGGWFGGGGDRGGQNCAGDRGADRGRFTPSFVDRGQRVDRGDNHGGFHGGDR